MAAATRTASTAGLTVAQGLMAAVERKAEVFENTPLSVVLLQFVVSVKTTNIDDAADEVLIAYFPGETYLLALAITATDMDTDATPALVFDINRDDLTTETTLINNTTIGQGGGSDDLDADGGHMGRWLTDSYLSMKTVTAADTPAAGTLTVNVLVARNRGAETTTD